MINHFRTNIEIVGRTVGISKLPTSPTVEHFYKQKGFAVGRDYFRRRENFVPVLAKFGN